MTTIISSHFKSAARPLPWLPIAITLIVTAMGGLFVAGVGTAAWWFLAPLTVAVFFGSLLTRNSRESSGEISSRQNWGNVVLLLGICCIISLSWLILRRAPLPLVDLGTAALVTVLFSLLAIGAVLYCLRLSLLSFPSLFLGTTFLFTCSPLIAYQYEGYDAFQWWKFIDIDSVLRAMPVVMLAFAAFLVGALLAPLTNPQARPTAERVGNVIHTHSNLLRRIGLALYVFSVLVIIAYTLQGSGLSQALNSGYRGFAGERKAGEMSRVLVAAFSWFLPWSLLMLTATSRNRLLYGQTLLLTVLACGMMFMAGDRTAPLALIMLVAASSPLLGFSIDWKRSFAVLLLVALLVPTIANLRTIPVREWSWELLIKSMTNRIEDRRIYEQSVPAALLTSMGTSYQTLMGTLLLVPDTERYRYGLDYLRAPVSAIPFAHLLLGKVGLKFDDGEPSDWLKAKLNPDGWSGQGYLQVAEAYLQFGAPGVVGLYILLGLFLVRLWWSMQQSELDSRALAFILFFMMALLTWVRNEAVGLMRPLLWGMLLIYLPPALLARLRRL